MRVINPLPGGSRFTNRESAKRYIKKGHAYWTDDSRASITFHECYGRVAKAETMEDRMRRERENAERGYDGINRPLTQEECANMPFTNAAKAYMEQPLGRRFCK